MLHCRLGHKNFEDVARLFGMKMPAKVPFCRVCTEAKATRHPLGRRDNAILTADRQAQVFSADIEGPFPIPSLGGSRYVLVIVDSFSRRIFTYMLSSPAEFFEKFRDLVHHCEAHFGKDKVVARFHSDGGTYFTSIRLGEFCRTKGIVQSSSAPYTQALNGMAERTIRTLTEMVRSMLVQSKAPRRLMGEAFIYATFIINALPAFSDKPESRFDLWYGNRQEKHLRIRTFGCAAWILDVHPQRDKLGSKGQLCILVGYEELSHCYRLATLPNYGIVRSAHVTFNESFFPCEFHNTPHTHPDMIGVENNAFREDDILDSIMQERARRSSRGWHPTAEALNNIANQANYMSSDLDWARGEVL
jgi:histone deacetylase 1/2